MNNLFSNGPKKLEVEGGVNNANSFKTMVDNMVMREGQMHERLENMDRAMTYNDLVMQQQFQNMNMNSQMMHHPMGQMGNQMNMDPLERQWSDQIKMDNKFVENKPVQGNLNTMNYNDHYYQPRMMNTQVHPAMLEFNQHLERENSVKETTTKVEENVVSDNDNNAQGIYKDIIRVMEDQGDERHQSSEFLKFVKRLQNGDIVLNDKENDIQIVKDSSHTGSVGTKGMTSQTLEDEEGEVAWKRIEDEMKEYNYGMEDTSKPLYVQNNPFLKDPNYAREQFNIDSFNNDYIELGKDLIQKDDYENARYVLEAEAQNNPDNSEAWVVLGKLHAENDRDDLAKVCFVNAIEVDPFNTDALLALGIGLVNDFEEFEGMVCLCDWIKTHHDYNKFFDNSNPLLDYNTIRNEMINDREGEDYYSKALRIEEMKNHFYRELCGILENINNNSPPDADLLVSTGITNFVAKNMEKAVQAFRKAVEINPKDHNTWNKLGAILAHSGANDQAIHAYKKALTLKPNYARCWGNLGLAHFNENNYNEAMRTILTALKGNPGIDHLWSYMTSILIADNKPDLTEYVYSRNLNELIKTYKTY